MAMCVPCYLIATFLKTVLYSVTLVLLMIVTKCTEIWSLPIPYISRVIQYQTFQELLYDLVWNDSAVVIKQ